MDGHVRKSVQYISECAKKNAGTVLQSNSVKKDTEGASEK